MRKAEVQILESFWQKLKQSREKVLLLDYDGTLAPFQIERDRAVPYPGVRDLLTEIQLSGSTRLIIISGRALGDLLPLLGLQNQPELWGSHGSERQLADGTYVTSKIKQNCRDSLGKAYTWITAHDLADASEKKPSSVTIHWRGVEPEKQLRLAEKVHAAWNPLTKDGELELHSFDGGLEIRCTGFNKGKVIKQILAECGPDPAIAFLGDDLTDEDGFKALQGCGLSVLVRPTYRDTMADCWLQPPAELLSFLRSWLTHSTS